jgi:hypothetical protein
MPDDTGFRLGRPIDRIGPLGLVLPLQVQFHAIACDAGVLGIDGTILEGQGESRRR